ncbi:MAG: peptidoglycan DD-metalloendopeptidase family protein [Candidatus Eremiobacteraeota bacterium]|nr:peptidoglycan DD-metalloendopeptidase family protein [Candidatus Eremiobacteraeota bacterium]
MTRPFLAAVLAIALIPTTADASHTSIRQRIEQERIKSEQLHERLHNKKNQLHAATVRVTDLKTQLEHTNASISRVNRQLGDLAGQAAGTQRRLEWNTVQLRAAEKTLKLHDDLLKKRLVDSYERGDSGYLSVLLDARSFSDFVERWHDLSLLISANQRDVKARKIAEKIVLGAQARLEAVQLALAAEAQAQQRAKNQLASLADERANLVAVADDQRRSVASQVAQIEGLSASEESNLEALIQEKARADAAAAAAAAAARRAAGGIAAVTPPTSSPGALSWPVTGVITSPFGYRHSPFGGGTEFHQGLDIGAAMGTTITAPAGGTVIMAQWYGGYGNYILIDHGGGMSTGYGHLSQIFVAVGQAVQKGQAVGAVGSTGASTGPHLHFEVRINGKPVDPAGYLH